MRRAAGIVGTGLATGVAAGGTGVACVFAAGGAARSGGKTGWTGTVAFGLGAISGRGGVVSGLATAAREPDDVGAGLGETGLGRTGVCG